MANTNFTPWLGSLATTNQQQKYKDIAGTGFKPKSFVKAGDFNAALRMTTLVCAGIARVFGFDSKTIDTNEDTITKAIQTASITLGDVSASSITCRTSISAPTINTTFLTIGNKTIIDSSRNITGTNITGTTITATGDISTSGGVLKGKSLNINGADRIDKDGNITGNTYKVGNKTVIDSERIITGSNVIADLALVGNSLNINGTDRIDASGNITGTSYKINKTVVIDSNTNIKGNNITGDGILTGKSLTISGAERITDTGIIRGASYNVGNTGVIDSSRNIKNIGTITATGDISTSGGVLKGKSLNINGADRIDKDGNIAGQSYSIGVRTVIDNSGNISGQNIIANTYIAAPYFDMYKCKLVYSGLFSDSQLSNRFSVPIEDYSPTTYQYLYYVVIAILYRGNTNYSTFSGWLPLQKLYSDKSFNGTLYMAVPNSSENETRYISVTIESTSSYNNAGKYHNALIDFKNIANDVTPIVAYGPDIFHAGTRIAIYRVGKNMINPPGLG